MLIAISAITGFVSISAFFFLFGTLVGMASSAIGLKICVITTQIKKYNSIIKKKKMHYKIVFLGKSKLNIVQI